MGGTDELDAVRALRVWRTMPVPNTTDVVHEISSVEKRAKYP